MTPAAADTDLVEVPGRDEALLQCVSDRSAVMGRVAPDFGAAGIEMRIDMNDGKRAARVCDRAQDRPGDTVVPADQERYGARRDHPRHLALNAIADRLRGKRRSRHVSAVEGEHGTEHVDAMDRV